MEEWAAKRRERARFQGWIYLFVGIVLLLGGGACALEMGPWNGYPAYSSRGTFRSLVFAAFGGYLIYRAWRGLRGAGRE